MWRYLWAAPNSLLGLLLALLLTCFGARWHWRQGVLEVSPKHRRWESWPFVALTLGHVVLAVSEPQMQRWRDHERVHVAQCERWGPLFLPAYLLEGLWQWLRGRRAYVDNRFEVQARERSRSSGSVLS
jgi:hypothetical protein